MLMPSHSLPMPGQCTWTTPHSTVQAVCCQDLFGLTSDVLCALVQDLPDWQEILTYFRGSELQNYFTRILEDDLKAIIKPQYVDHIPKVNSACEGSCQLAECRTKQLCTLWLVGSKLIALRATARAVSRPSGPQTSDRVQVDLHQNLQQDHPCTISDL